MLRRTLSTSEVARLVGVAAGSVANWVDRGLLKAGRTPGGHRRIYVTDLRGFLRQQNLPMPAELLENDEPLILVVDDEPAVAGWLATEIAAVKPTWRVEEAHGGFVAGQLIGSMRPHVVVLDLRMPDLDGFEVCRRIKGDPTTQNTAVIAMTAYPSAEVQETILACGAQVCLAKPLEIEVLLEEIERAVSAEFRLTAVAGGREE